MKNIIEIRHVEKLAGHSKKTGNHYDMRMAQCIVHKFDTVSKVVVPMVGVLTLPEIYKDLGRGVYEVEFDIGVNRAGRVASEVALIIPVVAGKTASSVSQSHTSHLEVINVVPLQGRSKAGNDYDMRLAQCFVHKIDRETGLVVELMGELLLPEIYKEITAGMYDVDFMISIDRDKRIGSVVESMTPVVPRPAVAAPAAAPASPKV